MTSRITTYIIGLFLLACSDVRFETVDFESVKVVKEINRHTEEFVYNSSDQLDVLIVVDNSTSMFEEQQKMGERMGNFLSHLEGVDWRVGLITTDTQSSDYGGGVLLPIANSRSKYGVLRFIDSKTENYGEKFLNTIQREEWGSSDEKPFEAIKLAFEKSMKENRGFFRKSANLAIVILTDEDDQSTQVSSQDILSAFEQFLGKNQTLSVHGVIIEPEDKSCALKQGAFTLNEIFYAYKIYDFILKMGGVSISICNDDYSSGLSRLGQTARRFVNSFRLSQNPLIPSVRVEVLPQQGEVNFSVKGNLVVIESLLQPNTHVYISYDYHLD